MGWLNRIKGRPAADTTPQKVQADPLTHHASILLPEVDPDQGRRMLAGACHRLLAYGHDMEIRIAAEVARLSTMDPADLADRFEHTPLPRIDAYPEEHVARLAWLEDVLRSEHADLAAGRIPLPSMLAIAVAACGDDGYEADDLPVLSEGARRATDETMALEARQVLQLPDNLLRHRFRGVPGVSGSELPGSHRMADRMDWIVTTLRAQETRDLCGLAPLSDDDGFVFDDLDIRLTELELSAVASGDLAFSGTLTVDTAPICRIASDGAGGLTLTDWSAGCGTPDVEALDEYVAVRHAPRLTAEGASRPAGLLDVLLDQVTMYVTLQAYHASTADSIAFCPSADEHELRLLTMTIPEGGTREQAMIHARARYPDAVLLDEMPEEDAALLWMSLS